MDDPDVAGHRSRAGTGGEAEWSRVETGHPWMIVATASVGALVAQMFGSIIVTAMPQMQNDLELTAAATAWVATSYFLGFAIGLLAGGRMSALWGEVRIIVAGYSLFTLALVVSAVAQDGIVLNLGRGLQGLGIGIAAPATLSIVVAVTDVRSRGLAIGIWGLSHGIGIALGPLLGGALTELADWRWIFTATVPLMAAVIAWTLNATRQYHQRLEDGRYDWFGVLAGGAGLALLIFGLQEVQDGSWTSTGTIATLIPGVALLVAFALIELRAAQPVMEFSFFRRRSFLAGYWTSFSIGFVYLPVLTFISSLYLVTIREYSPTEAGLLTLIMTVPAGATQPVTGILFDRFGARLPCTLGLVLAGVGSILLVGIDLGTSLVALAVSFVLVGIGAGLSIPGGTSAGMSAVSTAGGGTASSMLQTGFVVCNSLGLAVASTISTRVFIRRIDQTADPATLNEAKTYAETYQSSGIDAANETLSDLPPAEASSVLDAVGVAASEALGRSFFILGIVGVASAVMVFVMLWPRAERLES